uniref:Uncharacterized protein n=1 Tax=Aegilops tauschii subsp. strangulata TaxID=200361 RepID=A0A453HSH3_AEGTS
MNEMKRLTIYSFSGYKLMSWVLYGAYRLVVHFELINKCNLYYYSTRHADLGSKGRRDIDYFSSIEDWSIYTWEK